MNVYTSIHYDYELKFITIFTPEIEGIVCYMPWREHFIHIMKHYDSILSRMGEMECRRFLCQQVRTGFPKGVYWTMWVIRRSKNMDCRHIYHNNNLLLNLKGRSKKTMRNIRSFDPSLDHYVIWFGGKIFSNLSIS